MLGCGGMRVVQTRSKYNTDASCSGLISGCTVHFVQQLQSLDQPAIVLRDVLEATGKVPTGYVGRNGYPGVLPEGMILRQRLAAMHIQHDACEMLRVEYV